MHWLGQSGKCYDTRPDCERDFITRALVYPSDGQKRLLGGSFRNPGGRNKDSDWLKDEVEYISRRTG